MPATLPACCGSRCRSRLIRGSAREILVRSMKAMVYMTRATGMMRSHRCDIWLGIAHIGAHCITGAESMDMPEILAGGLMPAGVDGFHHRDRRGQGGSEQRFVSG